MLSWMEDGAAEIQRVAEQVAKIADAYVAAYVEQFPERAELNGIAPRSRGHLSDNSLAALYAWHALEDGWATTLDGIDPATLRGRREWVTLGFLREAIMASRKARICRFELWPANHLSGWQVDLAQIAEGQPVGTTVARDLALARWSGLPGYLDTEVDNLREGLRLGFSTPRSAVEKVVQQLDDMLAVPVTSWSFFGPATRDGSVPFVERWTRLLTDEMGPAIERYRDYVRNDYLPHARAELAITAHPDGEAAYHAAFRLNTTIERSGVETYELGSGVVERHLAEALAIGRTGLGTSDLASLVARAETDPTNRFDSREALITFARETVARSRDRMPAFFSNVPDVDVVIEPYPTHVERDTIDDSYWPAADDGSRPSRYLIAAYHFANNTRANAEITAVHEAYPGHHLQVIAGRRTAGAHAITRLVSNPGFDEGWARYAEALAEEMGLYRSPYAAAMRRLWPARGMVADPGIHLFGWTPERTAAFLAESGRMTRSEGEATVDRIAVWPGQLAAYDTGGLEIVALRREAEAAHGDRFDIREFHEAVLGNGPVTLPMLREQVRAWIDLPTS